MQSGHFGMQFTKCHTTAMSFSVLLSFLHFSSSVHQNQSVKSESQRLLAGLSAFAMHERGWLGVSDSEDEQPLYASAAHKQGWVAVDELGDFSMDDTGWQDAALQEDGAVSNEEDGLVQAAAQAAERSRRAVGRPPWAWVVLEVGLPVSGQRAVRVVEVQVAETVAWHREQGAIGSSSSHLKRAFSNGRHQSSSSSMPRLILFNARPWKMPSPVARRPVKVVRLWIQLQSRCSLKRRSREH